MSKILVIGSTGKTGSRVYERLQGRGVEAIPASRNSAIPFDWYDQSTWSAALRGIEKVYVTFQPDLAVPQSFEIISNFVAVAKHSGVKHMVLLSGRGESAAAAAENVIMNAGIAWTIVRASFFMQNFSEGFWADGIAGRQFAIPKVNVREPFVDIDDLADVVVAALTDDKHQGHVYELTGPELLSFSDTIRKLSDGLGFAIEFFEMPLDAYKEMLKTHHVPDDVIALIAYLFTEVLDGRNESLTSDIEKVLNRRASSFDHYVSKINREIFSRR